MIESSLFILIISFTFLMFVIERSVYYIFLSLSNLYVGSMFLSFIGSVILSKLIIILYCAIKSNPIKISVYNQYIFV